MEKSTADVIPLHDAAQSADEADAPPWYAWYWAKWQPLANGLTLEQQGALVRLFNAYWIEQGPLPDDDNRLAAIVGVSPRVWRARFRETLAERFQPSAGAWHSSFMDRALRGWKARSTHGTKAAHARWQRSKGGAR